MSPVTLDLATATSLCTSLRMFSSQIRDNLSKRLQTRMSAAPDDLSRRSLDKSGSEVQSEAMQMALLMQGLPADEGTRAEVLTALRAHDANPEVASFLQYWSTPA